MSREGKTKTSGTTPHGATAILRTPGGGLFSVRLYALDQVEAQAIVDTALVKPSRQARRQKRGWKRGAR